MMNSQQLHILALRETDVFGALDRCNGSEELYMKYLEAFVGDKTIDELNAAVKNKQWDDAFTAAHALKGLAGNMDFIPLMHALSRLVILIRGGRLKELDAALFEVNSCFRDIKDGIKQILAIERNGNN